MREIEDLLPQVMPYAHGCAEPVAVQHLRDAAIRLCERTRCWRHIDTFNTKHHHGYDDHDCSHEHNRHHNHYSIQNEIMAVPNGASLFEIEWARYDCRMLETKTPVGDMMFHDCGEPRYITQVNPSCIAIEPRGHGGELTVSMFLKPSQDTDQIPSFMIEQFARALADGALSTLLLLQNQPFSNPQMAMLFESKFQAVLDRNFAFNLKGQQRARPRTKPNFL